VLRLQLTAHLLLLRFPLFPHLLLMCLLKSLHLLPERLLLLSHLLSECISFLLFLLFGQGDTFPGCLHLRPHGKPHTYGTNSDADDEIEKIYEFHSYCLMIVQYKDTKKTLMLNVQGSINFVAFLSNYNKYKV
jgi:hypothetical protein